MNISVHRDQWLFAVAFAALFLFWNYFFVGLKTDHIYFASFISIGSILSRQLFKVILGFSAFIAFFIIYDSLQVYPNYEVNTVSISELYQIEMDIFGFELNGREVIPNEYLQENQKDFASFFLGLAYLMWIPAPLIFSGILFAKNKKLLLRYSYCFLFVNLIGMIGYYLYPAAPPWYYFEYGQVLNTHLNGDAGMLTEFDRIVGFPIFDAIYNRGANVFAAIPSLHCAFPIISLFYAIVWRHKISIVAFSLLCVGTWIAAVYSQHHYVVDVVLGIFTAFLALVLYEGLGAKKLFGHLLSKIYNIIGMADLSEAVENPMETT